jgi:hypothetical protein
VTLRIQALLQHEGTKSTKDTKEHPEFVSTDRLFNCTPVQVVSLAIELIGCAVDQELACVIAGCPFVTFVIFVFFVPSC